MIHLRYDEHFGRFNDDSRFKIENILVSMPKNMVAAQSQILKLKNGNLEFMRTENENFAVTNFRKMSVQTKLEVG